MDSDKIKVTMPAQMKAMDKELDKLTKVWEKAQLNLNEARKKARTILGKTKLTCTTQSATGKGCCSKTAIKDLTYIQTFNYNPNTGSPNGGYHEQGEGGFKCGVCGKNNRLYLNTEIYNLKS